MAARWLILLTVFLASCGQQPAEKSAPAAKAAELAPGAECLNADAIKTPDVTIISATVHEAGVIDDHPDERWGAMMTAAHCRVIGRINPAQGSDINFQAWMPIEGWNGKLFGVGNGGYAGSMFAQSGLAEAVTRGYAAVMTDTGHEGGAVEADWAYGAPEKVIDWGHRAFHLATVAAKDIVAEYFGQRPDLSIYSSCSNGGRMALMEAQRYPEDYDAIIAGAPAYDFTRLMTSFAWNALAQRGAPEAAMAPADAALIHQETIRQCDSVDGLTDGLVSQPDNCEFDAAAMLCKDDETSNCLSSPQVEALKKIYDGVRLSDGSKLFAGWPVGGEQGLEEFTGWNAWTLGADSYQGKYAAHYFQNIVGWGPGWSLEELNFDQDLQRARAEIGSVVDATNPDLTPFKKRGGKLIIYHGLSDAAIPAAMSVEYYNQVLETMNLAPDQDFIRLFLVPGMFHCYSGLGPNLFNNLTPPISPKDPERDIAAAIERWVEGGDAPDHIIAIKASNFDEAIYNYKKAEVIREGLICAYPKNAVLKSDKLDPTLASSYRCE